MEVLSPSAVKSQCRLPSGFSALRGTVFKDLVEAERLGRCGACTTRPADSLFQINRLVLIRGHGAWGNGFDGAVVPLCHPCRAHGMPVRYACAGWPGVDRLEPIDKFVEVPHV